MKTKKQYVAAISELMPGIPKKFIEEVLKAQERVVGRTLGSGKPSDRVITVPGVVRLVVRLQAYRSERRVRNPSTGKMMLVPEKPATVKVKAKFPVSIKRAVGERLYQPKSKPKTPRRLSRYERPPVI